MNTLLINIIFVTLFWTRVSSFGFQMPGREFQMSYGLPTCTAEIREQSCSCRQPVYNLSAIPTNVDFLQIGIFPWEFEICSPRYILPVVDPLPSLPKITRLDIGSVSMTSDDPPFPIAAFLTNVKKRVVLLFIQNTFLPTIARDTFEGFFALLYLQLKRNRMSTIALDAFESFAPVSGSASSYQLGFLDISDNNFKTFDWSVFEPLAADIAVISLSRNKISELSVSHPFVMRDILRVSLDGNNLTDVEQRFLDSLSASGSRSGLNLQWNPLCLDDEQCHCSSLNNLRNFFSKPIRDYLQRIPGIRNLFPAIQDNAPISDTWTCGNYTIQERSGFQTKFSDSNNSRTYGYNKFGETMLGKNG
ncbi:uncharacterized protein LOC129592957 [Paramacrobiotus metropolitanus]|uniref:uncharacterized protein LOC129592957 n=1 Tax=Paramacrobiotus metropolitanus TaxID=2943436 RepID=UPI002446375A|nr:uncharacterized protein LOC129592957 [Paramacrobiotus metropolitanus]